MGSAKKRVRVLVVDDEPLARRNLRVLLDADPEVEVVGEAAGGAEAVRLIRERAPDLVFLDIQMPEVGGFEVIERVGAGRMPVVVFVTAFDRFALRAFEVHALDYLLKPFDDARFERALRQAKLQVEQRSVVELGERLVRLLAEREGPAPAPPSPQYLTRLLIKASGRVFFLKVEEIDWIGAEDYYVKLHVGRKAHLLRETMNDLGARLDPRTFIRIHRSTIVNVERIRELRQLFGGDYEVVLRDGTALKLSRSRREQMQQLLKSGRL